MSSHRNRKSADRPTHRSTHRSKDQYLSSWSEWIWDPEIDRYKRFRSSANADANGITKNLNLRTSLGNSRMKRTNLRQTITLQATTQQGMGEFEYQHNVHDANRHINNQYDQKEDTQEQYKYAQGLEAIQSVALAASTPIAYATHTEVIALLIRWAEEGKLRCEQEVKDLADAFWDGFNYTSLVCLIPTSDSSRAVTQHVREVASNCVSGQLLIVYYAGHGSATLLPCGLSFSQDRRKGGRNGIAPFSPIRDILDETQADVLLLLDRRFASSAARSIHEGAKVLKQQRGDTSAKTIYAEMKRPRKQLQKSSRAPDGDRPSIHVPKFIDFSDAGDDIKLVAL
ncbi:uncharacterized protein PAC_11219 [Phialocephala subalpina]|uniref:Uncharacterized protein n=1 Tax=Phialocephala subalpina TaxID=576137 RepID=A0A1L7X8G1_9HELO|nr:uncharacterized protein PAC_11219 [Phialocephala subalpina]